MAPAFALALLMGNATAQGSAAQIESDIAFARGLAAEWSFVDLAEDVIRGVESGRLEDEQAANLALLRCEIYTVGARNERDGAKRDQLFAEAISCLKGYVEENPYAENRTEAELALIDASKTFARSLQIALDDAIGEEAEKIAEQRVEVLLDGVATTNALIESVAAIPIEDRTEAQTATWLDLQLTKGQMYASISAAQDGDPYTKELAINTLSDLVFDAGEGTPYALRAYAALGDLYSGTGEHEDAAAYYGGVIEQVIPTDPAEREELLTWSEMPLPVKQRRFLFVELAMPGVLDSNLQLGDDAEGMRLASFFWNIHRSEGLELSAFGYDSLLQVARVMLNSDGFIGGDVAAGEAKWFESEDEMKAEFRSRRQQTAAVDFALRLATQVTEDAPSNTTKNSARNLLSEIAERPGVEISADFAYEAALGKYRTEDYVGAEAAVDELLLRLDTMDSADRALIGAKVYSLLGDILRRSGRDLEAAMAYREAALNWDDPELNENIAKRYKAQIDSASRAAGTPDELVALQREAEDVVSRKGPKEGGAAIAFDRGRRSQAAQRWEEAIEHYSELKPTDEDYEPAYVNIGVCLFRSGKGGEALQRFTTYLDDVRTSAELETESPSMLARRKGASAAAEFYRGYIYYLAANRKYEASGATADFQRVVDNVSSFEDDYGDQESLAAITMKNVIDAHAKLGNSAEAKAKLEKMAELYPDNKQTGAAAISVFLTFQAQREKLVEENADAEAIQAVTQDMAEFLALSNQIDASPSYANLDKEGDLWLELENWEKARDSYARVVTKFGDSEQYGERVGKYVVPDLALAMLELRQVNEAKDLIAPLAMAEGTNPSREVVRLFAMATCGWIDGDARNVNEIAGAGGTPEEFEFISGKLRAMADAGDKWTSCKWYEIKLMEMYSLYSWGKTDARKTDTAKSAMEGFVTFLAGDTEFATVETWCTEEEETPAEIKARLGDGVLKRRYRWMYERLR